MLITSENHELSNSTPVKTIELLKQKIVLLKLNLDISNNEKEALYLRLEQAENENSRLKSLLAFLQEETKRITDQQHPLRKVVDFTFANEAKQASRSKANKATDWTDPYPPQDFLEN